MSNKVIIGIVVVLVVVLAIWFYMQNGMPSTTGGETMTSSTTDGTMTSSTDVTGTVPAGSTSSAGAAQ